MTKLGRTTESHRTSIASTELQVDIHENGEVMVQFGESVWINVSDLAEMVRFIERHGDVSLANL